MGSQYGDENDDDDDEDNDAEVYDEREHDRSAVESTTDGPYNETLFAKGQGQRPNHAHDDDEHNETPPETPSPQKGNTGGVGNASSMISSFSPFKAFQRRGLGGGRAVYPVDLDQLYSEEEAACLRVQQDHDQGHSFSPRAGSPTGLESESGLPYKSRLESGWREESNPPCGSGSTSGGGPEGEVFTYDDLDGCRRPNNHYHDDRDADEAAVGPGDGGARRTKIDAFEFEYERDRALRHEYDEYPFPAACSGANTASQASVGDVCVSKSNIDNDYFRPAPYNAPTGTSPTTLSSSRTS